MKTKTCFKCGEVKSLSAFYRHTRMLDKHLNKCKECTKKDVLEHRNNNLEAIRAYDRGRGNRQKPGYGKEYYRKNKEKRIAAQRKWREANPLINEARNAVSNAVRDGRLFKDNCEVCGASENIHGHHEDYSKPLEVSWLCRKHHGEAHRVINEIKRNGE